MQMKRSHENEPKWFRLDNAAKIYPVVASAKNSGIYRISVYLRSVVDPVLLQQAVIDCRERFPSFYVKLHRGLFWYYFETNPKNPIVYPENPFICRSINVHTNNHFQFTFFHYRNRISLEMFHSLSDGGGAFQFLKTILYRYHELKGTNPVNDGSIFKLTDQPDKAELEDSYRSYYTRTKPKKRPFIRAYRIKGSRFLHQGINLTVGHVPTESLLEVAKAHKVSLSEYIVGLYLWAIIVSGNSKDLQKHPVAISVPVNLRQYYPSRSIRNFSLFFNVRYQVASSVPSLDEILETIKKEFVKGRNIEEMQSLINLNVRFEKNPLIRIIPLFFKKLIFKIGYAILGDLPITSSVTNLGTINLPESLAEEVERFEVNIASGRKPGLAMISYRGNTAIALNRCRTDSSIEKNFFSELAKAGLKVTIQSNYWE